jgi:intein/homing endonuclease
MSDFSLLDGYGQVEEYADRAVQINMRHLAVTDHGMMGAVPRQIRACEIVGIQPVFGMEAYLNDKHIPKSEMEDLSPEERVEVGRNYHLLMLAYTKEGYKNLVQMSSQAWLQFYKKPRLKYDQIDKHKEGVIFTSSCYIGEIGQAFDHHGPDAAEEVLKRYIAWFSPNFYLEMMLLDFKKQKPYDAWLVKMHDKYHVPMIISGDCHYCRKQDSQQQRRMLMIRGKKTEKDFENIEDGQDYFELQDSNLWMKSEAEMDEMWARCYSDVIPLEVYVQAKKNTVEIARKASGVEIDRSIKLPQIPDADAKFKEAVMAGYKWRGLGNKNKYINRLSEEVSLICRKGFSAYFIIQQEIVKEARRVCPQILGWGQGDEAIGPGRGCHKSGTKIVLSRGEVKKIEDVSIGDKVITRSGEEKDVLDVLCYNIENEDLLNIKTYYGDSDGVSLTKDHKVLVEKLKRPDNYNEWADSTKKARRSVLEPIGELKWLPACELEEGDWLFVPKPKIEVKNIDVIDLAEFCDGSRLWFDNDYVYQDTQHTAKKINRYIKLDTNWFEVIGKFAGDGYLNSKYDTRIYFCFNSETEKSQIEKISKFFENMGVGVYAQKSKTRKALTLSINNKYIQKLFKYWFCDYEYTSQTKHIPSFVFNQSDDRKVSFLRGYFLADGCEDKHKVVYTTVSERLAYQTRFLCSQLSIPSSVQFVVRKDNRPGRKDCPQYYIRTPYHSSITSRDTNVKYQWRKLDDGVLVRIRKICVEKNVDKVYDLSIKDNHNYLTTSFLTHNSAVGSLVCYCLGITDVDPLKHDLLFSRFLSDARGAREIKTRFTGIPMPEPLEECEDAA